MEIVVKIGILLLSFFAGMGICSAFMYPRLNKLLNEYIKRLEQKQGQ